MNTVVVGEDRIIFAALAEAFATAGETGEVVMTVTVSECLPDPRLTAAPDAPVAADRTSRTGQFGPDT